MSVAHAPEAAPVAWVTGAANGIGRRLVTDLLAKGHRVAASDIAADGRDAAAAEDGWPEDRVERIPLDVRSPEQWEAGLGRIMSRWGKFDWIRIDRNTFEIFYRNVMQSSVHEDEKLELVQDKLDKFLTFAIELNNINKG